MYLRSAMTSNRSRRSNSIPVLAGPRRRTVFSGGRHYGHGLLYPLLMSIPPMLLQHGDRCRTQGKLGENLRVVDEIPQT